MRWASASDFATRRADIYNGLAGGGDIAELLRAHAVAVEPGGRPRPTAVCGASYSQQYYDPRQDWEEVRQVVRCRRCGDALGISGMAD